MPQPGPHPAGGRGRPRRESHRYSESHGRLLLALSRRARLWQLAPTTTTAAALWGARCWLASSGVSPACGLLRSRRTTSLRCCGPNLSEPSQMRINVEPTPRLVEPGPSLAERSQALVETNPVLIEGGGGDCWSTQAPMWPKLDQSQANWGKFSRTRPKLGLTRPLVAYKAFGTSQACSWSNRGRRRSGRSPERRAQREVLSDDLSGRGFPTAAGGEPWESELPPNPSIDLGGHKRHRREAWPVARRTARGSGKRPRGLARCAANVAPKPLALDHSPLPTTTTESR